VGLRATVYIPNLNGGAKLLATLDSLRSQSVPVDVVVVDNGSNDEAPRRLASSHPDVQVLALRKNLGFGRALNHAVRHHPSDQLIFLNNDVVCEPQFVETLLDELGKTRDAVAAIMLSHSDPGRIESAGVVVDRTGLGFDYLRDEPVQSSLGAPPPLGPTGGAALFRLDAFSRLGGYDERIFAYLEDVDLAIRLRAIGGRCGLAPAARLLHHHSTTLGSGSSQKNAMMGFSRGYLLRRYGVLSRPGDALRALAFEAILCSGQLVIDRNAAGIGARLRGWRSAAGLEKRKIPDGAALDISFVQALRLRARFSRRA
jgi:GT2 family glycosyltransferase